MRLNGESPLGVLIKHVTDVVAFCFTVHDKGVPPVCASIHTHRSLEPATLNMFIDNLRDHRTPSFVGSILRGQSTPTQHEPGEEG